MHEAELLRRLIELERRMAGSERERLQPWEQPLQVHRDQFLPAPEGGGAAAHAPTHGPATGSDPLETGIAGTIAIGDTAAEGTADDLARSDHRHALPAPAAPADVTKAAASAGAATTAARSDHKHDVTTAAPAAAGVSAASGEGAATMLARSDHTHQSNTAATTIQPDDAAAVGTSGEPARADHKHAIVAAAPAQGVGGGNTEGAATSFARSDHDHTLRETGDPTDLTVGAIPDGHHLIRSGGALIGAEISQRRHFVSERMSGLATFLPTDGTAYWAYIGRTSHAVTLNFVNLRVTTGGSGAQTAEVALASSPLAPNRAAQTLTKIAASGSLDGLTTAGVKQNTVALAAVVPAFTHLWAGVRTSMGGAEPTTSALSRDHGQGELMSTDAAGALTGAGPWLATPLADAAGQCLELRASID